MRGKGSEKETRIERIRDRKTARTIMINNQFGVYVFSKCVFVINAIFHVICMVLKKEIEKEKDNESIPKQGLNIKRRGKRR